jgi:hypothetical protein
MGATSVSQFVLFGALGFGGGVFVGIVMATYGPLIGMLFGPLAGVRSGELRWDWLRRNGGG